VPAEPSQRGGLLITGGHPTVLPRAGVVTQTPPCRSRRVPPPPHSNDRAWLRARFARVLGDRRRAERKASKTARPQVIAALACAPRGIARFILPNADGLGCGLFLLDPATRRYLLDHIDDIPDPLMRGSAWVDLWENFLEAKITPPEFLDLATRALPKEKDEQIRQRVLANLTQAFWRFLPPEQRSARAPTLEAMLRAGIAEAASAGAKSAWFTAFRNIVLTSNGLAWLERVWRRQEKIKGLPFAEEDETVMALELAVHAVPGWLQILTTERDRIQNQDRRTRFEFVMPALSADPAVRRQAFERFRKLENRRHEPWVLDALRYLHHPLRADQSRAFILPSLELPREIQSTGDILPPALD
jgi:aminopeptidase N